MIFCGILLLVSVILPAGLFGQLRVLKERTITLDSAESDFTVRDLLPNQFDDAFVVLSSAGYQNRVLKINEQDAIEWETWYGTQDSAIQLQELIKPEIGYKIVGTKRVPVTASSGVITQLRLSEEGHVLGNYFREDSAFILPAVGPLAVHSDGSLVVAGRIFQGTPVERRSLYMARTDAQGKLLSSALWDPVDRDSIIADRVYMLDNGTGVILGRSRRKIKFTTKFYYDAIHQWFDTAHLNGATHLSSDTATARITSLAKVQGDSVLLFFKMSYHEPSTTLPGIAPTLWDGTTHQFKWNVVHTERIIYPASTMRLSDGSFFMVGYSPNTDTNFTMSEFYAAHFTHDLQQIWDSAWGIAGTKNVLQELRKIDEHTLLAAGYQGPDSARKLYYVKFGYTPLRVHRQGRQIKSIAYPIPATDQVIVQLSEGRFWTDIALYNLLGEKQLVPHHRSGIETEVFDIRSLTAGHYFIVLTGESIREIVPCIVNR
jgi:hypothetical protein